MEYKMILTSDKLDDWMRLFQTKLVELFASRLKFLGIQGSCGRGEQTVTSDIDVVVILDEVSFTDLQAYRKLLSLMEHSEQICGFVAGEGELRNWEKSDLLQLVLDTKPVIGSFEDLYMLFSDKDIQRAVLTGLVICIMPVRITIFMPVVAKCLWDFIKQPVLRYV